MPRLPLLVALICVAATDASGHPANPGGERPRHGHAGGHASTGRPPVVTPHLIGRWGAWRAATHAAAGSVVCYAFTRTASSNPPLPGRGDVVLTVTERPGALRDAVALIAGFTYPPGSSVEVTAGDVRMAFYTAQRSAFARSGRDAVRAFEAAGSRRAVAAARSPAPHGRAVVDTFSLDGFDDAHAAIQKACPAHA